MCREDMKLDFCIHKAEVYFLQRTDLHICDVITAGLRCCSRILTVSGPAKCAWTVAY